MKRLFLLIMLSLFAFVFVGCGKKDIELEAPKNYDSSALELAVFDLIENYKAAKNYGVKLTSNDGTTTLVTELKMNKEGNAITSMSYTQTGGENNMHVYISSNTAYMLTEEGDKIKYEVGASEQSSILRDYGFNKFIEDVESLFLDDADLYTALPVSVEVKENVASFALDLLAYDGTYFTEATAVTFKITFTGNDISAIEILVTKDNIAMSNKVEFLGLVAQTVNLPADAASYVEQ
ncbi:MAG: hypothetical protein ACOX4W_04410 [Bacilli bacterium]|jgi:hypothetical protein